MITAERLGQLFEYSQSTGLFIRKIAVPGSRAGTVAGCMKSGYVVIRADKVLYRAHRLAWLMATGSWPIGEIDHINGVKNDNRLENLRDVSVDENRQNQRRPRSSNKSGYLGVRLVASNGKFKAEICINKKNRSLGHFDTAIEAHAAYVAAKRQNHKGNTL